MIRPVLVRGARQLLTLRGPEGPRRGSDLRNLSIVQDGAVLIVDGVIREVGPSRRIENLALARQADEIDASGRVVMPGFVDSHTHLIGGRPRIFGYEMKLPEGSGADLTRAVKSVHDTPGHTLEATAYRVLDNCVRHGTTTIEAKSGLGLTETGEIKILRVQASLNGHHNNLVSTFMAGQQIWPGNQAGDGDFLNWLSSYMLPLLKRRRLAVFADIACQDGGFSLIEARQYLARAKELGFGLKVHAGDSEAVKLAIEAGAISADHALYLDAEVIGALAASSTITTLLPAPIFHSGLERFPSARSLIDSGAAIALATDFNAETCPTHSMQMIVSLACNKMNMTPSEAIAAGTINGAHALGLGATAGSIEARKDADLIILDVADYREIPYHFGGNLVSATMKKGRIIHRASEVQWASTN